MLKKLIPIAASAALLSVESAEAWPYCGILSHIGSLSDLPRCEMLPPEFCKSMYKRPFLAVTGSDGGCIPLPFGPNELPRPDPWISGDQAGHVSDHRSIADDPVQLAELSCTTSVSCTSTVPPVPTQPPTCTVTISCKV